MLAVRNVGMDGSFILSYVTTDLWIISSRILFKDAWSTALIQKLDGPVNRGIFKYLQSAAKIVKVVKAVGTMILKGRLKLLKI